MGNLIALLWETYQHYVRGIVLPNSSGLEKDVSYWRNEIFLSILLFISPLSIIALVPSVYMSFANGVPIVGFADLLVFGLIIMIMSKRSLTLKRRKAIFITIIFCLSVILLFYIARPGLGMLFLLVVTVFSSAIYSSKAAFYSAIANTIVCCCFAVAIYLRLSIPMAAEYTVGTWIAISSNLIFLSFVCAECLNLLLRGLESSLNKIHDLNRDLERKVDERTKDLKLTNHDLLEAKEEIHSQNEHLEQKIIQRTTQYAFISQINQSIVHSKDEQTLLHNACQIAIRTGNFKMAWIGMFDAEYKKLILSEQQGMAPEQLDVFRQTIMHINGPEAKVLTSNTHYLCNDIEQEFNLEIGKAFEVENNIRSRMVLPIRKFSKIVGVFSFYASERHFFGHEEIALLSEVAGDISFALENFEKEERHRATENLVIKNEKRFRALVENGADAVAILSNTGGCIYVSPSIKKILGYTEQEAAKTDLFSLIHPDDLAEVRKTWAWVLSQSGIALPAITSRMRHKDDTWRWIESTFTNMLHDKSLDGIVNNFRDITERIVAEQNLSNSAVALSGALSELQKIMDASLDMICSIDRNGRFVKVSQASEPMLGYKGSELVGKNYMDMVVSADVESTSNVAAEIMNGTPTTSFENRYIHKDGHIVPILWSASWDHKDMLMYCIAKDVTERKKDDAERLKLIVGLQAKNKDLQQFSYIVSHNLRAPIANILGLVSIIDKESSENSALLEKLAAETGKLDDIVKDINVVVSARKLEIEKIQTVRFEAKLALIVQVLDNGITESGVTIVADFRMAEAIQSIKGYVYSIIYNLVSNAIKYRRMDIPTVIELKTTQDDHYICLSVKDNGIGIDLEKYGTKIFGLYKRFHSDTIPGKGIGLNLVKTHAETLGGRVEVESVLDGGTTFRVYLPKNYGTIKAA